MTTSEIYKVVLFLVITVVSFAHAGKTWTEFVEGYDEGIIESGGEPVGNTTETKDWNDSYFELTAGVVYTLF